MMVEALINQSSFRNEFKGLLMASKELNSSPGWGFYIMQCFMILRDKMNLTRSKYKIKLNKNEYVHTNK